MFIKKETAPKGNVPPRKQPSNSHDSWLVIIEGLLKFGFKYIFTVFPNTRNVFVLTQMAVKLNVVLYWLLLKTTKTYCVHLGFLNICNVVLSFINWGWNLKLKIKYWNGHRPCPKQKKAHEMARQCRRGQCEAGGRAGWGRSAAESFLWSFPSWAACASQSQPACRYMAAVLMESWQSFYILELPKSCVFQLCFSEQGICVGIRLVLVSSCWPVWITWRDMSLGNWIIAERRMFLWKWRNSPSFCFLLEKEIWKDQLFLSCGCLLSKQAWETTLLCTYFQPCITARASLPWLLPCACPHDCCQPESPKEILEIVLCL